MARRPCCSSAARTSGMESTVWIAPFSLLTIAVGVPAGATMPVHSDTSKSARPASAMVGTLRKAGLRLLEVMARPRSRPLLRSGASGAGVGHGHQHGVVGHGLRGLAAATIGDVLEARVGALVEKLGDELEGRRARRVIRLAGIGASVLDQLANGLHRLLGADHHHHRERGEQRDRREILLGRVGQPGEHRGIDRERPARRHQQRVAVGRRLGDELGRDDRLRARLVLDDDRLAEQVCNLAATMRAIRSLPPPGE